MRLGVGEAAAVELGGKIYVAGGFDTRRTFQIYDIAGDTWTAGPDLPFGTDNAGAVAIGGKIHILGGEAGPVDQVYDVAGGSWTVGSTLPGPRFASVVELLDGKVHLVGGWSFDRSNNVSLASHDVFDPALPATSGAAPAPTARNHAFSGAIAGKLYVTGGRTPGHEGDDAQNVATTEVYDPAADGWTALAPLPNPRSGGASVVLDGKLYVLGGGLPDTATHATIQRFDPATGQWEQLGDMPTARTGLRAVAANGSLYVFGGFAGSNGVRFGNGGVNAVYRYTPPAP
jgi:N-acetylneuraminic acid mutarotase